VVNPIYTETFALQKARLRTLKPFPLLRPFQDSSLGPMKTSSCSVLTIQDASGHEGESLVFSSALPVLEKLLLPILFQNQGVPYPEVFRQLYWSIRNEGFRGVAASALGQLDWALYDLAARRQNLPLHTYLGSTRHSVPVYASGLGTNYSEKELEEEAWGFEQQGFRLVKMKVGKGLGVNIQEDVKRVKRVRAALGDGVDLAVDADQIWTVREAVHFVERVSEQKLAWIEEPVHSADLQQIQEICRRSPVPVAYGESEKTGLGFPSLISCGVRHLQPHPGELASVEEWLEVARLARQHHLRFSAGGYSHFTAQLVAALPNEVYTEYLEVLNGSLLPFLAVRPELKKGWFHLPELPGSCVRLAWDEISKQKLLARDVCYTLPAILPAHPNAGHLQRAGVGVGVDEADPPLQLG
jgi:L-alanine-DL-glutamate epimerase-like enolase superfamily enzyme